MKHGCLVELQNSMNLTNGGNGLYSAPKQDFLRGFREEYQLHDEIQFADYSTRELQNRVTPQQVLEILREGNKRFHTGNRISRDFSRQVDATAPGQSPLAVVLVVGAMYDVKSGVVEFFTN